MFADGELRGILRQPPAAAAAAAAGFVGPGEPSTVCHAIAPSRRIFPLLLVALGTALAACSGDPFEDGTFAARFELPAGTHTVRIDVLEGALTFEPGEVGAIALTAATRKGAPDHAGLARLRDLDMRLRPEPSAEPGVFLLQGPRLPDFVTAGRATTPAPERFRLITRCLVRVPADIAVEASTRMGHVAALGRRATVRLETGNGMMRLDDCAGDAVLRSGRGSVVIDRHRGSLDIELATFRREKVEEREGDLMQIFVDEIGPKGILISAPHAHVQCHVPAAASFVMDVTSGCGRAKNGFRIPVEPVPGREFGKRMVGTVGEGGPPVRIAVEFGNVSIAAMGAGG